MHIVVFGIGAIGGFYGITLARYLKNNPREDFKISFIARGQTFENLKHFGAKLICKRDTLGEMQESIVVENNFTLVKKYQELEINPEEYTLVLLCVKSKDTVDACEDIKTKLTDKTAVISVQNGIENEERIAKVLGSNHAIGSLTTIAAETLEPGIYLQKGGYGFTIGELVENIGYEWANQNRIDYIYNFFKEAGLSISQTENIKEELWIKLVWNAAFNPISVLYENTVGQLLSDPKKKALIEGVMFEVTEVAAAEGYKLPEGIEQKQISRTTSPVWHDFRTSMLQDFQKGREIELDDLLGVIVRKAKEHDIDVPNAEKVFSELSAVIARS